VNSDKAAAVRDSVNGCPEVVDPDGEDLRERDGDPFESHTGKTLTGDRVETDRSFYRPAYIEQSGTVSDGDGAKRPVFVVVLEALWHEPQDVRSLSPELVYEVAKHDCRIRFYPPDHRLDGDIWIVDHFTEDLSRADGDQCAECQSTYFKMRDGDPVCAKCGTAVNDPDEQATPARPTIGDLI